MQQMQDRIIQLSQQNKDLSFKEEAIKVQLESIYSQLQNEREGSPLRRKISDILDGRYAWWYILINITNHELFIVFCWV